jgi:chemotaxis methyl-accepting protein methylase
VIAELCAIVEAESGLALTPDSVHASLSRLVGRRVVSLGLERGTEYLDVLATRASERRRLVQALMNCDSAFFTDLRLVRAFTSAVKAAPGETVRVWDVGCGTGALTYTLAISAAETGRRVEIVATDLDANAIEAARKAEFGPWEVRELGPELQRRHFTRDGKIYRVRPGPRELVRFEVRNAVGDPPPEPGRFDVVVCAGVFPTCGEEAADQIALRVRNAVAAGGTMLFDEGSSALPSLDSSSIPKDVSERIAYELRRAPSSRRPLDSPSRSGSSGVEMSPSELELALDETRRQVRDGELEAARKRLSRLVRAADPLSSLSDEPVAHQLWAALGNVHAASGSLTHAMRCYLAARRINPVAAETVALMGAAQWRLGHQAEARRLVRKARYLDSASWPVLALASEIGGGTQTHRAQLAEASGDAMKTFRDPFKTVAWWAALEPVLEPVGATGSGG